MVAAYRFLLPAQNKTLYLSQKLIFNKQPHQQNRRLGVQKKHIGTWYLVLQNKKGIHSDHVGLKSSAIQKNKIPSHQLRHTKQQRGVDAVSPCLIFPAGWHSQDGFVKICLESAT